MPSDTTSTNTRQTSTALAGNTSAGDRQADTPADAVNQEDSPTATTSKTNSLTTIARTSDVSSPASTALLAGDSEALMQDPVFRDKVNRRTEAAGINDIVTLADGREVIVKTEYETINAGRYKGDAMYRVFDTDSGGPKKKSRSVGDAKDGGTSIRFKDATHPIRFYDGSMRIVTDYEEVSRDAMLKQAIAAVRKEQQAIAAIQNNAVRTEADGRTHLQNFQAKAPSADQAGSVEFRYQRSGGAADHVSINQQGITVTSARNGTAEPTVTQLKYSDIPNLSQPEQALLNDVQNAIANADPAILSANDQQTLTQTQMRMSLLNNPAFWSRAEQTLDTRINTYIDGVGAVAVTDGQVMETTQTRSKRNNVTETRYIRNEQGERQTVDKRYYRLRGYGRITESGKIQDRSQVTVDGQRYQVGQSVETGEDVLVKNFQSTDQLLGDLLDQYSGAKPAAHTELTNIQGAASTATKPAGTPPAAAAGDTLNLTYKRSGGDAVQVSLSRTSLTFKDASGSPQQLAFRDQKWWTPAQHQLLNELQSAVSSADSSGLFADQQALFATASARLSALENPSFWADVDERATDAGIDKITRLANGREVMVNTEHDLVRYTVRYGPTNTDRLLAMNDRRKAQTARFIQSRINMAEKSIAQGQGDVSTQKEYVKEKRDQLGFLTSPPRSSGGGGGSSTTIGAFVGDEFDKAKYKGDGDTKVKFRGEKHPLRYDLDNNIQTMVTDSKNVSRDQLLDRAITAEMRQREKAAVVNTIPVAQQADGSVAVRGVAHNTDNRVQLTFDRSDGGYDQVAIGAAGLAVNSYRPGVDKPVNIKLNYADIDSWSVNDRALVNTIDDALQQADPGGASAARQTLAIAQTRLAALANPEFQAAVQQQLGGRLNARLDGVSKEQLGASLYNKLAGSNVVAVEKAYKIQERSALDRDKKDTDHIHRERFFVDEKGKEHILDKDNYGIDAANGIHAMTPGDSVKYSVDGKTYFMGHNADGEAIAIEAFKTEHEILAEVMGRFTGETAASQARLQNVTAGDTHNSLLMQRDDGSLVRFTFGSHTGIGVQMSAPGSTQIDPENNRLNFAEQRYWNSEQQQLITDLQTALNSSDTSILSAAQQDAVSDAQAQLQIIQDPGFLASIDQRQASELGKIVTMSDGRTVTVDEQFQLVRHDRDRKGRNEYVIYNKNNNTDYSKVSYGDEGISVKVNGKHHPIYRDPENGRIYVVTKFQGANERTVKDEAIAAEMQQRLSLSPEQQQALDQGVTTRLNVRLADGNVVAVDDGDMYTLETRQKLDGDKDFTQGFYIKNDNGKDMKVTPGKDNTFTAGKQVYHYGQNRQGEEVLVRKYKTVEQLKQYLQPTQESAQPQDPAALLLTEPASEKNNVSSNILHSLAMQNSTAT